MYFAYGILRANLLDISKLNLKNDSETLGILSEGNLAMLYAIVDEERPVTPEGARGFTQTLSQIVQLTTIIPLRFGTLFEEEEHMRKILHQNNKSYLQQLSKLEGKIEVELRVWWKKESFQQAMMKNKRLGKWKKALEKGSGHGFDVVEFGKEISEVADLERMEIEKKFLKTLRPLAVDYEVKEPADEFQAFDGVFLVEKTKEKEFDNAVGSLYERCSQDFMFKYTGPWAPHHFVEDK